MPFMFRLRISSHSCSKMQRASPYSRRNPHRLRIPFIAQSLPQSRYHCSSRLHKTLCLCFIRTPPSFLKSSTTLETVVSRESLVCKAALAGRIISQKTEPSDTAIRRRSQASGESSQALTIRKEEPCATVEFRMKFRTDYGQLVKVVGSAVQFGSWAIAKCPALQWTDDDVWSITLELPIGNIYEYKYVVVDSQGASVIHWQKGNNCVLAIGLTDKILTVKDNWEGNPGASVTSKGKGISTKEERLLDWATEMKSHSSGETALVLEKKLELEKAQEEKRLVKQESSRLKSELRMASMTRQAAEQQVKELQVENRKLMALLTEQQNVHRNVMEETLKMLEAEAAEAERHEILNADQPKATESSKTDESSTVYENGSSSIPAKSKKPRKKSNRRQRRSHVSTRTAAIQFRE